MEEKTLSEKIQELIEKRDMNVSQFAKFSGIPFHTLYGILKKNRKPRRKNASKLCRAFKGEMSLKDFGIK